jgi:penicillin-binding protein 1A
VDTAERAGIEPPIPDQPSMALGTVSVSPLELTSAYTPFAASGEGAKPRLVLRVERPDGKVLWAPEPERRHVLPPEIAYLITDVLREAITRGTGTAVRQAGFQGPVAGKTGTTNDGADAWFVGYTPDVVASVWMGFDQPRPIVPQATGGRLAAPVWARMMLRFYQGRPLPKPWSPPAGVIEASVDPATGLALAPGCQPQAGAARREVFLARNAPREVCPWKGEPVFYATSPEPVDEELMAELPPEQTDGQPTAPPAAEPAASPPATAPSPSPSAEPTPTPAATPEASPEPTPTPTPPS